MSRSSRAEAGRAAAFNREFHAPKSTLEVITSPGGARQLGRDLQDADYPIGACSPEPRLLRWKRHIAARQQAHVRQGPTEAAKKLIKRVKGAAFGFTSFRNYRIRSLLRVGKPGWDLLGTSRPH